MTFDERLAALGVDLSDLPKPTKENYAYECSNSNCLERLRETINNFEGGPAGVRAYVDYIFHLVDIIDRMETRLVNVTGELAWMKSVDKDFKGCYSCLFAGIDAPECDDCGPYDESQYVYAGVPEEWSVDA